MDDILIKNKEILETFKKLHKIKKMGERTQELIEGIKKEVKIKIEVPFTITFSWKEGDACDTEIDWEPHGLSKKVKKISENIGKEINQEIKEICDLSDQIGVLPDELLDYYEKHK